MNDIRVMLVDHNQLLRECLQERLQREPALRVVAVAANGPDAVRHLRGQSRPHVALVSAHLPGWSGPEVTRRLLALRPALRVIGLTATAEPALLAGLAQAGAVAWVAADCSVQNLVQTIHAARHGRNADDDRGLHPALSAQGDRAPLSRPPRLTNREVEILQRLRQGGDNRQIGHSLGISGRTVQSHLSSIYAKLNVTCRTEAALEGLRRGLIRG